MPPSDSKDLIEVLTEQSTAPSPKRRKKQAAPASNHQQRRSKKRTKNDKVENHSEAEEVKISLSTSKSDPFVLDEAFDKNTDDKNRKHGVWILKYEPSSKDYATRKPSIPTVARSWLYRRYLESKNFFFLFADWDKFIAVLQSKSKYHKARALLAATWKKDFVSTEKPPDIIPDFVHCESDDELDSWEHQFPLSGEANETHEQPDEQEAEDTLSILEGASSPPRLSDIEEVPTSQETHYSPSPPPMRSPSVHSPLPRASKKRQKIIFANGGFRDQDGELVDLKQAGDEMPKKSLMRAYNKKTGDNYKPFRPSGDQAIQIAYGLLTPEQSKNKDYFKTVSDEGGSLVPRALKQPVEFNQITKEFVDYRLTFSDLVSRGLKVSNLPISEPKGLKKAQSWLKGTATKAKPIAFSQQQICKHLLAEAHACSELCQKLTMIAHQEVAKTIQHLPDDSVVRDLDEVLTTLKRALDHNWQRTVPMIGAIAELEDPKLDKASKAQILKSLENDFLTDTWKFPVFSDEFTDTSTHDPPKTLHNQSPLPKLLWEKSFRTSKAAAVRQDIMLAKAKKCKACSASNKKNVGNSNKNNNAGKQQQNPNRGKKRKKTPRFGRAANKNKKGKKKRNFKKDQGDSNTNNNQRAAGEQRAGN